MNLLEQQQYVGDVQVVEEVHGEVLWHLFLYTKGEQRERSAAQQTERDRPVVVSKVGPIRGISLWLMYGALSGI